MKNSIAILFLFLLCISIHGQEYKFKVKQFNIGDGLAHTDATSFAQDSNGFIWIGTFAGLNKFDGYNFELFRSDNDQLSSPFTNRIMGLSFENNLLFMATQGGLVAFKTDTETYLPISYKNLSDSNLKQTRINHVYAKNGKLFLASPNQIHVFDYRYEENALVLEALKIAGEKTVGAIQSFVYHKQDLWLSGGQGLFRLSPNSDYYLQRISSVDQFGEPISITNGIFLDHDNKLWAGGQNSLHQLDMYTLENGKLKGYTFQNFENHIKKGLGLSKLTNFQVSNIHKTSDGSIWVGTDYGLVQLKTAEQDLDYTFYPSENNLDRNQISSKRVNGLFEDQDNNLWITTFGGGVNYINLKQKQFYHLSMEYPTAKGGLTSNFIRALAEDSKGNLWIGTERNGLFYYDFSNKSYSAYVHKDNDANSILSDAIRSLKIDDKNQLWIGSLLGVSILDVATGRMEHLKPDPNTKTGLTGSNIFDIQQDKFGAIWAGSWLNGLNRITKTNGIFEVQQFFEQNDTAPFGLTASTVSYIYTDLQRPEVLVSTINGINHIYLDGKGDVKEIKHYVGVSGYKESLSSNFIWPLVRENDSLIWVGTIGGGLNKLTLDDNAPYGYLAEKVAALNQAPFSDIESLELDNNGILWIGGNGLSRYDKTSGDFDNFTYADGLQGNSFKIGASHYGASGKMYFGGTQGITYFYPNDIQKDTTTRKAVLTKFSVNGKRVGIGEPINGHVILSSDINEQDHIKLVYGENDFTIHFSSLSYSNPNANNYRYKLEGYDKEWSQTTGALPFATYSNLDYGDYTFKVSASKGNDSWSNLEKELLITLTPPWWSSVLAKIIYFLIATALFYFIYRWFMLKKAYDISIIEKNQKEEINRLRLQFFTNISHEFRTPLTLIINPLQELAKGNLGKRKRIRYYSHMLDNTKRMLRLVNELMDFQKIETKAYELNPTEENINDVIHEVYQNFSEFAISRDIEFGFVPKEKVEAFWFDRTVLEKIFYNILGNAFKYTKSGGQITIELFKNFEKFGPKTENKYQIWNQQSNTEYVWIKISDTGRGIAEREIKFIFDRFFHKSANDKSLPEGSGVGLSLVKSLVNLHKGSIVVTSIENVGTTFYISVPYTKIFEPGITAQNNINLSKSSLSPVYDTPHLNTNMGEDYGKSAILIVEDNSELRFFMKENFEDEFHVLEAENGEDAIATLNNFKPDLIISDVNMPKMDGIEFCRHIKESEAFSSIPFILLTSNQTVEKQLEGLQAKADLYLSKPFSIDVLKISIQNIISNRKDLKHKIVENTFEAAHELIDDSKDNDFIKKVTSIINENIEDNDFDVSMLSDKLGMSRTKVYNKIKEITGKASGEIIREIRVRKAASLLASEDISIAQAMYKVGIQSQSYFTKVFKKEFGKTPSKFVQDIAKKK